MEILFLKNSREECLNNFVLWLYGISYSNIEPRRRAWIIKHMLELKDSVLGCYCKPEKCHGDTYVEILDVIGYENFLKKVK